MNGETQVTKHFSVLESQFVLSFKFLARGSRHPSPHNQGSCSSKQLTSHTWWAPFKKTSSLSTVIAKGLGLNLTTAPMKLWATMSIRVMRPSIQGCHSHCLATWKALSRQVKTAGLHSSGEVGLDPQPTNCSTVSEVAMVWKAVGSRLGSGEGVFGVQGS